MTREEMLQLQAQENKMIDELCRFRAKYIMEFTVSDFTAWVELNGVNYDEYLRGLHHKGETQVAENLLCASPDMKLVDAMTHKNNEGEKKVYERTAKSKSGTVCRCFPGKGIFPDE